MDPWKSVVPVYVSVSLSYNLFEKLLVHVSSMTTKRSGKSCVCIMCLLEGFSICRMIGWLLFKTDVSHNCWTKKRVSEEKITQQSKKPASDFLLRLTGDAHG